MATVTVDSETDFMVMKGEVYIRLPDGQLGQIDVHNEAIRHQLNITDDQYHYICNDQEVMKMIPDDKRDHMCLIFGTTIVFSTKDKDAFDIEYNRWLDNHVQCVRYFPHP